MIIGHLPMPGQSQIGGRLALLAGAWRIAVRLQWDLTAALSGCVCPATTAAVLPQKSVLNLSVDFV